MSKTVLFQTIQFSISTQFSSIWSIDRALSGSTTPGQSGHGSNGNEGVLCIPQSSSITGASPSDCFVSYLGHSLGEGFYPSAEKQSVYSTAPADGTVYFQGSIEFFFLIVCSFYLSTIICLHIGIYQVQIIHIIILFQLASPILQ